MVNLEDLNKAILTGEVDDSFDSKVKWFDKQKLDGKIVEEQPSISPDKVKEILHNSYHNIIKIMKEYIDTTEDNYKIISLWVMGTYFHEKFNTYPYLFFNAMRGSGKTRILKLISTLGAKGDGSVQNNLTEAVLFRIPRGTTTCIDEVEQIGKKDKQTLRELLNSAYKKGMKVKRMKKSMANKEEKQVVEAFEPYFPICLANIWGMDEVLGDRSITITLEKSDNQAITKMIEDFDTNAEIIPTLRDLRGISVGSGSVGSKINITADWNNYIKSKYTTNTTNTTHTTHTYNTTNTNNTTKLLGLGAIEKLRYLKQEELFNKIDGLGISGRNLELFLPLMFIAEEIGVLDELLEIFGKFTKSKKDDEYTESKDVSLYDFVVSIKYEGLNYLSLKDLTRRFREYIGEQDMDDKWLNEMWMGRAFKRLNLITDTRRVAHGRELMLNYSKAMEKLKIFKTTK